MTEMCRHMVWLVEIGYGTGLKISCGCGQCSVVSEDRPMAEVQNFSCGVVSGDCHESREEGRKERGSRSKKGKKCRKEGRKGMNLADGHMKVHGL